MKKLLLLAAAATAFAFVPASAAPGNGCSASGGAQNAATTCTYVSTGSATRYVASTPNSWTVSVVRNGQAYILKSSDSAQLPSSGFLDEDPAAGETVTVTMGPDCVPGDFVCGSIGSVTVGETA